MAIERSCGDSDCGRNQVWEAKEYGIKSGIIDPCDQIITACSNFSS